MNYVWNLSWHNRIHALFSLNRIAEKAFWYIRTVSNNCHTSSSIVFLEQYASIEKSIIELVDAMALFLHKLTCVLVSHDKSFMFYFYWHVYSSVITFYCSSKARRRHSIKASQSRIFHYLNIWLALHNELVARGNSCACMCRLWNF